MKRLILDSMTGSLSEVDVADESTVTPPPPPTSDGEVLDELINLLVAQGVITNV